MQIPSSYIINTAHESQLLDTKTSEDFGIDAFTLMEVAGHEASKYIYDHTETGDRGLFLCGKGNNGGDALVAARYLVQHGRKATVVFVSGTGDLSPLAQQNYRLLQTIAQNDPRITIHFTDEWQQFDQSAACSFVVDGMLGTGLNSDLRGDIAKAVAWINEQQATCFAMDIPTGLQGDSGQVMGAAVQADHTLAFGTLKLGFYLNQGFRHRGDVHFCELPFPDYLKDDHTYLIDDGWLPELYDQPADHKYEAGVVYIIAGSPGLTGAAIMAAKSAWSAGAGAVILITPQDLLPIFENQLPEIIKKPVGEQGDRWFKKKHAEQALQIIDEKEGTVLVGPGMGRRDGTVQFIHQFLTQNRFNCVVDADALWALGQVGQWPNNAESLWLLTPHPGELKTLLDEPINDDYERLQKIRKMALNQELAILSKGNPALLATQAGQSFVNGFDSRCFSRAGYGDVLAGKITAYHAMDDPLEQAAVRALTTGEKKMKKILANTQNYIVKPGDIL